MLFSSPRGMHHGILWISLPTNELLIVDRRDGWYITPDEVGLD